MYVHEASNNDMETIQKEATDWWPIMMKRQAGPVKLNSNGKQNGMGIAAREREITVTDPYTDQYNAI